MAISVVRQVELDLYPIPPSPREPVGIFWGSYALLGDGTGGNVTFSFQIAFASATRYLWLPEWANFSCTANPGNAQFEIAVGDNAWGVVERTVCTPLQGATNWAPTSQDTRLPYSNPFWPRLAAAGFAFQVIFTTNANGATYQVRINGKLYSNAAYYSGTQVT